MARSFVDTNVFFYAVDARDPGKQKRARALLAELARAGEGVVSTQVVLPPRPIPVVKASYDRPQTEIRRPVG